MIARLKTVFFAGNVNNFLATILVIVLIMAITSCKTRNDSPDLPSDDIALRDASVEYFRFDPASNQICAIGYKRCSEIDYPEHKSPYEIFNLYRTDKRLKNSELIRKKVKGVEPSPSGEYLLLEISERYEYGILRPAGIIAVNTKTGAEISNPKWWRDAKSYGFESFDKNRWLANGYTFWLTNGDGAYIYDLKNGTSKKLVKGQINGRSFSKDGRYFLYEDYGEGLKNSSSDHISSRIGITTKLRIYDRKTNKSRVLIEEASGWIDNAVISGDNKTIYYSLTTVKRDLKARISSTTQIINRNKRNWGASIKRKTCKQYSRRFL